MVLLKSLHKRLLRSGLTVATAESCTGGLLAKYLTDLSGSSGFFKGSIVTYCNESKVQILKVKIKPQESAVKKRIAISMAKNCRKFFKTDFAIATTGYMEPHPEIKKTRATGFCFVAICFKISGKKSERTKEKTLCAAQYFYGSRTANRDSASLLALRMLDKVLT